MINLEGVEILLDSDAPLEEEIVRNARMILTTIEGTVPFDRGFGMSPALIDMPINEVQDFYIVECTTKLRVFEPRATVQNVSFTQDDKGMFCPRVVLSIES